jgi:hypothetical protein
VKAAGRELPEGPDLEKLKDSPIRMRKKTRLLGVILTACGYIWLMLWFAHTAVPLPRSIFTETDEKYPPTRMYSHSEVLEAVGSAMTKFGDNSLGIIVPSSLMLLGGILIHRGSKVLK